MQNRIDSQSQSLLALQYAVRFNQESFDRNLTESVFINHGLDTKYLPKIQKKTDAKRAIMDYHNAHKGKGAIITSVESTSDTITMQINAAELMKTEIFDAKSGDYVTTSKKIFDASKPVTVIYDCVTDSFINDDPDIIARLESCLKIRRSTYPKNYIKDSFIDMLIDKVNATKVADGMDLLLVPASGANLVKDIESAIRDLDSMANITHYEIAQSVANQVQISNSIMEKMENFNNGVKSKIEKFVAESAKMTDRQKQSFVKEIESQYKFLDSYKVVLEDQYQKAIENLQASKELVEKFYTTGDIINPYQKMFNENVEKFKNSPSVLKVMVDSMKKNYPNFDENVVIPDEVNDLIASVGE